jgi:hypothetical protein
MKIESVLIIVLASMALMGAQSGQKPNDKQNGGPAAALAGPPVSETASPDEMARIAFERHGSEKFRSLRSLSLLGSAELYYGSNPSRPTLGKFALVQEGNRIRLDVETPDLTYREIYDGKRAYGSVSANIVPPPTRFGLPTLARFDQTGYSVSPLPYEKNQRGFRVTDSEGNSTDFIVDHATGRVLQYSFEYNGIKFLIEYKSFKEVEGVLAPSSFLRKMVLPRVDVYMEFKVKEAKVNQPVADDVFIIPEK